MNSIPSPSSWVKIQFKSGKVCLGWKGKTLLGQINKLFVFKSLLTTPSNVLTLHLKQTFPPIIWIFTQDEGDGIESSLSSWIFFTLLTAKVIIGSPDWNEQTIAAIDTFWDAWVFYCSLFGGLSLLCVCTGGDQEEDQKAPSYAAWQHFWKKNIQLIFGLFYPFSIWSFISFVFYVIIFYYSRSALESRNHSLVSFCFFLYVSMQ